ncbi:MAG TPA: hypothetical protein DEG71_11470 [Clostridiales bacterium]|nr:hypothetical protein [Clostridiales bacterium]
MEKIFTPEELIIFNSNLLGRGAPTKKDDIGYNKPDYTICNNYYSVLSNVQLADLSTRLIKYCKTQLSADPEQMKNTANYYSALTANTYLDNSISIDLLRDNTLISFTYNATYINIIKSAKNRKYNPDTKKWYVANNEAITILQKLQRVGADCQHCIDYLQENLNLNPVESADLKQVEQKVNIIKVVEVKGKLEVCFNYDQSIVTAIKSLIERKYNPSTKCWTIPKTEVNNLINKLTGLPNIDITALTKYTTTTEQIPEIILPDYTYLTRTPFSHQLEAAKFLLTVKKGILADEMGGGKTLSSILAANTIPGKKLIIVPASLKLNWEKEIRFVSTEPIEVINGKGWINTEGWTIVNYDIISKHIDSILAGNFQVVIFDECHYIKAITNSGKAGSKRADIALQIAENTEYCFMLTGTPITNKTKDIFNSLKAINHPLSKNFFAFGKYYCNGQHNGYGWDFNGSSHQAELNEKLQPFMLRRLKVDLLDLPEKIRSFIPVSVNLKAYDKKLKEYMTERKNKNLTNKGEHLVYLNAMRHLLAKEKVTATIEQINNLVEQEQSVVIFTCYNFVVDEILKAFPADSVKLTGDCSQKQRQEAVEQFQAGNKKVFISNIIAGGVGITLTKAQTVIVNDFDWVPANHAQSEDRIHRIGQNEKCNIIYMYASKAQSDEIMAGLLEKKLNNISQIIDGNEQSFLNELLDLM